MGSESAARLGAEQMEHAKRKAFIVVDENMNHFKQVLCTYIDAELQHPMYDNPTLKWAESALEAVNAR